MVVAVAAAVAIPHTSNEKEVGMESSKVQCAFCACMLPMVVVHGECPSILQLSRPNH